MPKPAHKPVAAKKQAHIPYKKIFFWLCIVSIPFIIFMVIKNDLKVANWPRTTGTIVTIKDAGTRYVDNYNATAIYVVNKKSIRPLAQKPYRTIYLRATALLLLITQVAQTTLYFRHSTKATKHLRVFLNTLLVHFY